MLQVLPTFLHTLIVSLLWASDRVNGPSPLKFELRHEHGVSDDSRIVFANIPPSFAPDIYEIQVSNMRAPRPESFRAFSNARTRSMRQMQSEPLKWEDVEVTGPNVKKRETLLQLAKMTYNSYSIPEGKDWYDLGPDWNTVCR